MSPQAHTLCTDLGAGVCTSGCSVGVRTTSALEELACAALNPPLRHPPRSAGVPLHPGECAPRHPAPPALPTPTSLVSASVSAPPAYERVHLHELSAYAYTHTQESVRTATPTRTADRVRLRPHVGSRTAAGAPHTQPDPVRYAAIRSTSTSRLLTIPAPRIPWEGRSGRVGADRGGRLRRHALCRASALVSVQASHTSTARCPRPHADRADDCEHRPHSTLPSAYATTPPGIVVCPRSRLCPPTGTARTHSTSTSTSVRVRVPSLSPAHADCDSTGTACVTAHEPATPQVAAHAQ
ncbi:hypothetical protein C8F04DRAFT_1398413 [Mycena alexandri]|uniref:Uncharacterized protein n=1 Tax=Mycena alexandri TaxID=1745969 RepID=A0AAD6WY22_9AGAR|nr:hypothetical protein C8F04DRAFT_1398413 [Mycena alexandri]